jgi:hypothetical protein
MPHPIFNALMVEVEVLMKVKRCTSKVNTLTRAVPMPMMSMKMLNLELHWYIRKSIGQAMFPGALVYLCPHASLITNITMQITIVLPEAINENS